MKVIEPEIGEEKLGKFQPWQKVSSWESTYSSLDSAQLCQSKLKCILSQTRYIIHLIGETGLLEAKTFQIPTNPTVKLAEDDGNTLTDAKLLRKLVGKHD